MAGPCGCRDAGCGCCFIENPDSEVPYDVYGSGGTGDCVKLNIHNIVTTIALNPNGTLTYTNETGATVTWFNGDHYSVDVRGELTGNTAIPNTVAPGFGAPFGPANPLTVTIVNPSTTRTMSVHTSGTGEEVQVQARTATAGQYIAVKCLYSLNGGAPTSPRAITDGEITYPLQTVFNQFNSCTASPEFVATVPPSGSWYLRLSQRLYVLSAAMSAGFFAVSQGQVITISGSTTV